MIWDSTPKQPFFQITVIDDTVHFTVEKSLTGECNVIQTVNKSEFPVGLTGRVKRQYLVGSILCGVNEANMLTESSEVVNALLSKVYQLSFTLA